MSKEVWGAGQQQLRNVHANVGAFHLNAWMYTVVEAWAWGIDRAALGRPHLCRAPGPGPEADEDVAQIAGRFGIDPAAPRVEVRNDEGLRSA
jgi:hypothetical protein